MTLRVTFAVRNDNPNTIWNRLAAKLGREPTHAEAKAEVQRILSEAACCCAPFSKGSRHDDRL